MKEKEVRDHSKTITFVFNSCPTILKTKLTTTQDITAKPSTMKNKLKKWLCSTQDNTAIYCCCNISHKVTKHLELSGLITGIIIVQMLFFIPIISYYVLVSETAITIIN